MNTRQLDNFLGKKLEALRVRKNWSIEKLAIDIGISAYQMQRYEQGVRIAASLLYRLAKLFDIPVNYFLRPLHEVNGLSK